MLISTEKKLLFVHIQKTGGTSIGHVLRRCVPDAREFLGTHDHALWAKKALGADYDNYFKFAFIRNPWDRLVSWYIMIKEKGASSPRNDLNRLWRYVLNNSQNFEEFLLNCTDTIEDVDGQKSFLYNQVDYISDEHGDKMVDFVGRYENFAADARTLFERIGIARAEIPHVNKSQHLHYSSYYTEQTRELVAERFRKDIEAFGYDFEDRPAGLATA
jgi:hypothetical protein